MSPNQRQFHRCPLTAAPSAALFVGRQKIDCWVIEMSIGGFGVLIGQSLPLTAEPLARLKFQGLNYIVRVTRQEMQDEGVIVALEQIEEIVPNTTQIPSTPLEQCLTGVAWVTAVCILVAAFYCLTGTTANLTLSLIP